MHNLHKNSVNNSVIKLQSTQVAILKLFQRASTQGNLQYNILYALCSLKGKNPHLSTIPYIALTLGHTCNIFLRLRCNYCWIRRYFKLNLRLHDVIYRVRFYSNSLIHTSLLSNSHNNVASIQKNRGDKSHRVIVALISFGRSTINKLTIAQKMADQVRLDSHVVSTISLYVL